MRRFIILAALANVAYCAAYPIDLFVQASDFRDLWRAYRWIVWAAGTLFALMLAAISLFGFGGLAGLADPVLTLTQ